MRVLYASPTNGVHDARFRDAWRDGGAEVRVLAITAETGDSEVQEQIRRFGPDLIQAGPIPTAGDVVARTWDGPMIATSWGFDLLEDALLDDGARAAARRVLRRAQVVLVDNDAVAVQAVELGAAPETLIQFPWGIDLESFRSEGPSLRGELGIAHDSVVVLSVRAHEALYDVQTLVRAFKDVADRVADTILVVGGSGSQTTQLIQAVSEAGIDHRTRFVGAMSGSRLAALYRTGDIYVSCARVDGSSISLLEAMASGEAPVLADIPGNAQWARGGVGLLFPVGDAQALAHHIMTLIEDSAARKKSARAAALRVQAEADWKVGKTMLYGSGLRALEHFTRRGES